MKIIFNLFSSLSILLASITRILYHVDINTISIRLNGNENLAIGFNYYLDSKLVKYEFKGLVNPGGAKTYEYELLDIKFDEIYIEITNNGEVAYETKVKITKLSSEKEYDISIEDSYSELIDIEYNVVENIYINHENKYTFRKQEDLLLPRILDVRKLSVEVENYDGARLNDAYLLFNKGFKGSFLEKEYDFYKVPVNIKTIDGKYSISLKDKYYYDFIDGVLRKDKTTNCASVDELILSRDDELITEAYLVINECGHLHRKVNIDLALKEQALFGESGYYQIKELR